MSEEETFSVVKEGDKFILKEMIPGTDRYRMEEQSKESLIDLYEKINVNINRHEKAIKDKKEEVAKIGEVDRSPEVEHFIVMMEKAESLKAAKSIEEMKKNLEEGRIKLLKRKQRIEALIPELKR